MSAQSITRLAHYNGQATTTPTKVSLNRSKGFHIRIKNIDATNNLLISWDSGNTYYTIDPGEEVSEDINFFFFYIQSSAGTADYRALVAEG